MKKIIVIIIVFCFTICCKKEEQYIQIPNKITTIYDDVHVNEIDYKNWFLKDIIEDSIPGISLEKAYNSVLKNKKGNDVIIAVIDTEVDKDHEEFENKIWINKDEIPNNGIDDDDNGYIDDINGWNFIGNKEGESAFYANFEATRVVRHFTKLISNANSKDTLALLGEQNFNTYKRALHDINSGIQTSSNVLRNAPRIIEKYMASYNKVKEFTNDTIFTVQFLDSLRLIRKEIEQDIDLVATYKTYGIHHLADIEKDAHRYEINITKNLNVDFNDRELIGDDPNNILNITYGNNLISKNSKQLYHATYVFGVLAKFSNVEIIPLCVSANGDEHDKDIALAIRYAVDNGASIINMSSGKDYSLHKDWVLDAIKYAEKHNVLMVTSSGNDSKNLDDSSITNFPNDTNKDGIELVSNFIKVGATTINANEKLYASFSNYGKTEVDIFAPGDSIYTSSALKTHPKYSYQSGTSYAAPLVSGVASLIYSYYPELSVIEIKNIIMNTGVTYAVQVKISETDSIKFDQLSKSGKILNAYNAMIVADSISKSR